jgi:hypothetical protein
VINCRETVEAGGTGQTPAYALKPPHYALTDITGINDTSLVTQGWVGNKPCQVTVDTGAYVTVARPDIAAGWPERQPHPGFTLQTVSGASLPILKEVLLTLTLGRCPLRMWVFVANITDELIFGLDVLRAYDASVDIGLRLADEEVSLWNPGAGPCPSSLVVAEDQVMPAQCEGIVMARMENPLGVENGLVQTSPQAHQPEGIYIVRTLVQDRQEVPVRVLNDTHQDQKLTRGSPLAHCEPFTLVTAPHVGQRQTQDLSSKLEDAVTAAKTHLTNREFQELKELLTEYGDIFAGDDKDYGRTNKVYHRIDMGDARPIRQPQRRIPLAKQVEVRELLGDMPRNGVIEESDCPWSSPIVLVRKNGELRLCVDYRKLKDVTKKDSFPLPRIDDTLDTLAGTKWSSILDLRSGCWQVDAHPDDKEKTAFSTGQGLWQFTVMPFGLCNAPATFERLMETVLQGLTYDSCLVYLDNMIGSTFQEHVLNYGKCLSSFEKHA